MQEGLIHALRFRRAEIQNRWGDLLHVEASRSPLANPDVLASMINWTLDEIFRAFEVSGVNRRGRRQRSLLLTELDCTCGRNPLLAYFAAGEQALQEALVLSQASVAELDPLERDASLAELNRVLRDTGTREIQAFCAVCQHRQAELADGSA